MSKHDNRFINLKNNGYLQARNAADSADIDIIRLNASNLIELASVPIVGGNTLLTSATGANAALSNLASVAINTALLPGTTETIDIGSSARLLRDLHIGSTNGPGIRLYTGAFETGRLSTNQTTPSSTVQTTVLTNFWPNGATELPVGVVTRNNSTNNTVATADVLIETGNKTVGTAASGNIQLRTGTATGTRGKVRILDGSEGVSGLSLQSVSTSGDITFRGKPDGNKNYLGPYGQSNLNGNFETGTTFGWVLGTFSLSGALPTGLPNYGAQSGNLTGTIVSSGQLAGSFSYAYTSSAATTAGNFVGNQLNVPIDTADRGKVLQLSLNYSCISGAVNANWSGTSSSSFAVALYDIANGQWVIPTGNFGFTQNTGTGRLIATFQSAINATNYRVFIYNANATAGAITMYFDDITLGPQQTSVGTIVQQQTSALEQTATFGAGVPISGALTGTTGQGIYSYNSGTGLYTFLRDATITVSACLRVGTTQAQAQINVNGVGVALDHSDVSTAWCQASWTGAVTAGSTVQVTNGVGVGTTDIQRIYISAQNFNTTSSNSDVDGRIIEVGGTGSDTGVAPSATNIILPISAMNYDTQGMRSGNTITIPVTGLYRVNVMARMRTSGVNFTNTHSLGFNKNGIAFYSRGINGTGAYNAGIGLFSFQLPSIDTVALFNAGDTITFFASSDLPTNTMAFVMDSFTVEKLNGMVLPGPTETVAASYYNSTAFGIPVSASPAILPYGIKDYDTHNAYNTSTGVYTAPVTGLYHISAQWGQAGSTVNGHYIDIFKNSSAIVARGTGLRLAALACTVSVPVTKTIRLLAGETISIRFYADGGGQVVTGDSSYNFLSIEKVGN